MLTFLTFLRHVRKMVKLWGKVIRNMLFPATLPSYVILESVPEDSWTIEKSPPESTLLNMLDALPENLSIAVKNLLAAHGLPENLDPFIEVGEKLEKLMLQLERLWISHCPFPTSTFQGSKTESMLLVDHWLLYLALFRLVREKFLQNLNQSAKSSTALKNLLAAHGLPENLEPFIEVGEKLEKLMQELERLWVDHCPFPNSYPQLAVENLQPTQGSKSEPALYHWLVYIALFRTVWEKIQQNLKRYGDLPPHWNDMSFDLVKVCPVSPESTEYKHLTYRLKHQGFTRRPISIERVQNKTLWKSYQLKKKELEEKNYSQSNEKILFHGTKANFIPNINRRGFNRSYAGMQGAKYGKGSYFSVNPNYAREFCGPDENGVKRMYIVRVLVGAFTLGRADIIAPPPTNHEAGDLFDSVVDTLERPTMYITFNDIQAYPEYLISFM